MRKRRDRFADDFPSTHASVIRKAADISHANHRQAQEQFFTQYTRPLRTRVKQGGFQPNDIDEALQDFFLHLLERKLLAKWDPDRGRLRHWLLHLLRAFLIDWWRANRARPDARAGSLDDDAEGLALKDILPHPEAFEGDEAFDRDWHWELFKKAVENVSNQQKDPVNVYLLWRRGIYFGEPPTYERMLEEVKAKFEVPQNLKVGTLKTAVSRLRGEIYSEITGQALREELPDTPPQGLAAEVMHSIERHFPTPEELREWPAYVEHHPLT